MYDEATTDGTPVIVLLAVGLAAGVLFAVTIHDVQLRLEQWDHRKHAED
jgi:hypothetical protein